MHTTTLAPILTLIIAFLLTATMAREDSLLTTKLSGQLWTACLTSYDRSQTTKFDLPNSDGLCSSIAFEPLIKYHMPWFLLRPDLYCRYFTVSSRPIIAAGKEKQAWLAAKEQQNVTAGSKNLERYLCWSSVENARWHGHFKGNLASTMTS